MYKFEKISDDEYKLVTDNSEHLIMRDINLTKELQSVDMYSTMIVADFLAERGETYDNTKLRISRKINDNGTLKEIVDESNLRRLEEKARNQAYYDVLDRIFNKTCNVGYLDIIKECGITNNEGVEKFVKEFTEVITQGIDDSPRQENTQRDSEEQ
jgi:hypothetical protein